MQNASKKLVKGDEDGTQLLIDLLAEQDTHGFNVDSIYRTKHGWQVIELLKCDTVRASESHPRRYWKKNWRKFASLWDLTTSLNGTLWLLNYEKPYDQFRLMRVIKMDPTEAGGIETDSDRVLTFEQTQQWYQALNQAAV